jgi:hypothetical protein
MEIDKKNKYNEYTNFWNNNIQSIESIKSKLFNLLNDLENDNKNISGKLDNIYTQINSLSSIYSNYNSIPGIDYILKLKSIINNYRDNSLAFNFNDIDFLIRKISLHTDKSLENFPQLEHSEKYLDHNIIKNKISPVRKNIKNMSFRWVSFTRNNSSFIVKFKNLDIITNSSVKIISAPETNQIEIKLNGKKYIANDIFGSYYQHDNTPNFYININNGEKLYAADKILKKIFAKKDFISPKVERFKDIEKSSFAHGRLKLYGVSHIVLK